MQICCVKNCKNKSSNTNGDVKFYTFPNSASLNPLMPWLIERRQKWIDAVKKHVRRPRNWEPHKYTTICSAHFIGNRKSDNSLHPAYIPTIFNKKLSTQKEKTKIKEYERKERKLRQQLEKLDDKMLKFESRFETITPKQEEIITTNTRSDQIKTNKSRNKNLKQDVIFDDEYSLDDVAENEDEVLLVCDDDNYKIENESYETDIDKDNLDKLKPLRGTYQCNLCSEVIKGFRFACVQCIGFDICSVCESRGAHAFHYMLRVSKQHSNNESNQVLHIIRMTLFDSTILKKSHKRLVNCIKPEVQPGGETSEPLSDEITEDSDTQEIYLNEELLEEYDDWPVVPNHEADESKKHDMDKSQSNTIKFQTLSTNEPNTQKANSESGEDNSFDYTYNIKDNSKKTLHKKGVITKNNKKKSCHEFKKRHQINPVKVTESSSVKHMVENKMMYLIPITNFNEMTSVSSENPQTSIKLQSHQVVRNLRKVSKVEMLAKLQNISGNSEKLKTQIPVTS